MKSWTVTIEARITKTMTISADTEDEAREQAHSQFSVLSDDMDEDYSEDVLDIEEVNVTHAAQAS